MVAVIANEEVALLQVLDAFGAETAERLEQVAFQSDVVTKKGEPMEFMTLEDQTGMYDATVFPNIYLEYCHQLAPNQAYEMTGLVEEHFSTVTVTVRTLRLLKPHDKEASSEPVEEGSA